MPVFVGRRWDSVVLTIIELSDESVAKQTSGVQCCMREKFDSVTTFDRRRFSFQHEYVRWFVVSRNNRVVMLVRNVRVSIVNMSLHVQSDP